MRKEQIEKQAIEEMARVIETTEQIARDAHCGLPSPRMYAKDLYWKGYRKQSEVERLRKTLDKYEETSGLKKAKAEVAREIFEEIETIAKTVAYPETLVNGILVSHNLNGMYLDIEDYAELKKKYTGEQT